MLKALMTSLVAATVLTLAGAPAQAANSQQDKMKECNAQAGDKKLAGDDRKAFMKTCLSSQPAPAATSTLTPQQQKMKSCNTDASAKKLKGDDRKAFMKTCLSGS
jgi:hypothetical protein